MLSHLFPTGFESGVLNGQVKVDDTIMIVDAGPVGSAALLTAQIYSSTVIIMIDLDEYPLAVSKQFGATHTITKREG